MNYLNLQTKIDIILSFASHEVLSLDEIKRHPLFKNVYFSYTESHFIFYFPFKNFCRLVSIPSDIFIPISGKQTTCCDLCEQLPEHRLLNVKIINKIPCIKLSEVTVDIIDAEETTKYNDLFQGLCNKNVFWHITHKKCICFVFIPNSSLCLKIAIACELAIPDQICIDALRFSNKSNAKCTRPTPDHLCAKLSTRRYQPEITIEAEPR